MRSHARRRLGAAALCRDRTLRQDAGHRWSWADWLFASLAGARAGDGDHRARPLREPRFGSGNGIRRRIGYARGSAHAFGLRFLPRATDAANEAFLQLRTVLPDETW